MHIKDFTGAGIHPEVTMFLQQMVTHGTVKPFVSQ